MSDQDAFPAKIAGFHVLPIIYPPLPAYPHTTTHYLYVRPHEPRKPTPSAPRSLFLVNVPVDATDVHLRHLLSEQLGLPAGRVAAVEFEDEDPSQHGEAALAATAAEPVVLQQRPLQKKGKKRKRDEAAVRVVVPPTVQRPQLWDRQLHRSGSHAVVTFVDRTSANAAIRAVRRAISEKREIVWGQGVEGKVPPLGSQRYQRHRELLYPDKETLMASVDEYMTKFAEWEAAKAEAAKRRRQEPDADGFVTVTRGGRSGAARPAAARERFERQQQRSEKRSFGDFYRFQERERMKARHNELLKKFEADREKARKIRERQGKAQSGRRVS